MRFRYLFGLLLGLLCFCFYLFHFIYVNTKEKSISELNSRQLILAKQAQNEIEFYFDNILSFLTNLSESDHIIDFDEQGKMEMEFALKISPEGIKSISRSNGLGKIINTAPFNKMAIGSDISYQKHVQKILQTHKPVVSDVFFAVQGYRAIAVHVPVFHEDEFKGTLAVLIDFLAISEHFLQDIKIGETGYAWMTSGEGIELYCPVPGHTGKSVFETCKDFPTVISMAEKMVDGKQGIAIYTFDQIRAKQTEMITKHAVFQPIRVVDNFWTIVVASSEHEVFASLENVRNKLMMVVGLLLVCFGIFSFLSLKSWGVIREEAVRRKAEKIILESEKKYRTLFESSIDALSILDIETGKFIDCNTAAVNIHNVGSRDGFIGLTPDQLSPEYQPGGELSSELSAEHIRLAFEEGPLVFEWTHKKPDDSVFPALVSLCPIELNKEKCVLAILRDITDLKKADDEREKLIKELQDALENIKTLGGLLPVCSHCKKIRDDKGYWNSLEVYLQEHSGVSISHGLCTDCSEELYGNEDWYVDMKKKT